jgi:ABC-type amino acid transport system permease subunit
MIGFTDTLLVQLRLVTINTTRAYKQRSAIADLHTSQFTAAHALGFSVSTSRRLVVDLDTGTITSNHCEVFF